MHYRICLHANLKTNINKPDKYPGIRHTSSRTRIRALSGPLQ